MGLPTALLPLVLTLSEEPVRAPEDEDVVAGWTAFGLFLLLAVAVALLGWSLVRQLKKVQRNREAGLFGEDEIPRDEADEPDQAGESGEPHDTDVNRRD